MPQSDEVYRPKKDSPKGSVIEIRRGVTEALNAFDDHFGTQSFHQDYFRPPKPFTDTEGNTYIAECIPITDEERAINETLGLVGGGQLIHVQPVSPVSL